MTSLKSSLARETVAEALIRKARVGVCSIADQDHPDALLIEEVVRDAFGETAGQYEAADVAVIHCTCDPDKDYAFGAPEPRYPASVLAKHSAAAALFVHVEQDSCPCAPMEFWPKETCLVRAVEVRRDESMQSVIVRNLSGIIGYSEETMLMFAAHLFMSRVRSCVLEGISDFPGAAVYAKQLLEAENPEQVCAMMIKGTIELLEAMGYRGHPERMRDIASYAVAAGAVWAVKNASTR